MADPSNDARSEDRKEEFAHLIQQVKDGSEEAARTLFDRYGHHILRMVRAKLHRKMRSQFDSQDFAQDVWASFFGAPIRETNFESSRVLVAFLANMTYHKMI